MSWPVIILKPLKHRGGNHIALFFDYNLKLINHVKKFKGIRWSATNKCWYVNDVQGVMDNLLKHLLDVAKIENKTAYQFSEEWRKNQELVILLENEINRFNKFLKGRRYSESTVGTYTSFVAAFLRFTKKAVEKIETRDIEKYCEDKLAAKNYSISSHRQFVGAMKQFKEMHYNTDFDVPEGLRPKASRLLPTILSKEEIIDLLRATKNLKHRATLAMIYASGLRISEVLNLKLSDIDFDRKQIKISQAKGRKDRYVVLAESILPLLENYFSTYQPERYFIEGKPGIKYSAESIRKFLKRSCAKAGIRKKVTPHTLRHSYATHLLEGGTDVRYIQELLGHNNPKTTMIYTHITKRQLTQVHSPLDDAVKQLTEDEKTNKILPISRNI